MDSIVEARVKEYLIKDLHHDPYDCGAILECIRNLARMAGHELDFRFALAGLGAGPEARIASRIVTRAMCGGGGFEVADYAIRREIDGWLLKSPSMGML